MCLYVFRIARHSESHPFENLWIQVVVKSQSVRNWAPERITNTYLVCLHGVSSSVRCVVLGIHKETARERDVLSLVILCSRYKGSDGTKLKSKDFHIFL